MFGSQKGDSFGWLGPGKRTVRPGFEFCREGFYENLAHVTIPNILPPAYEAFMLAKEEQARQDDKE